jgi:hypothetical protein
LDILKEKKKIFFYVHTYNLTELMNMPE